MEPSVRKICVVTGTRAEYGLLRGLVSQLQADPDIELQIVVTGAHLSEQFGSTWREIENDGLTISAKVDMLLSSDTPVAVAKAMGLGTIGMADAFDRLRPDLIVLLGDRYEILSAAQAAMVYQIPIAHIHGGETTIGVIDEAIRHCLTKMSQLHFVAAEAYRNRVLQLGEAPERVFTVGALGLDGIAELDPITRSDLEDELGLPLDPPVFLLTCHPETLEADAAAAGHETIEALEAYPNATIVITGTNADPSGRVLGRSLRAFADKHAERVRFIVSLGQRRYLNLMREADVVIGNSSSGVLEAPSLGTPTVDIGIRQQGRLRAPSVIGCEPKSIAIREAIEQALSPEMQAIAARKETPYGSPGAGRRIVSELRTANLDGIMLKRFHDFGE